jgi:SAM-dependent methyltransferase
MSSTYVDANRELWNLWTKLNVEPDSEYSALLKRLEAGGSTLKQPEVDEVGDVAARTLLHLQCHIGLDSPSWAQEGAIVTGVDLSENAIALARSLSRDLSIDAEFICSDLYDLPAVLDRQFDIVYTSEGVLCWLPDLDRWAEIVAHHLKPAGTFYIMEGHPIRRVVHPRTDGRGRPVEWGYFHGGCIEVEERRSNGNPTPHRSHTAYYWSHTIGKVVTALCSAGLGLEFLHEFPGTVEDCSYEEIEPGRYEVRVHRNVVIPTHFSTRATG